MKGLSPPAKITRPKLSAAVPRKRLFSRLNEAMAKPVTWVSAPGGSGKTTLVSSYLDFIKLPCIWYQVDQGDADPATFFYYMTMAAKKWAPKRGGALPQLAPVSAGMKAFASRYFERLFDIVKPPFAMVLDNYQEVPDEGIFQEMMETGLSIAPDGVKVFVLSRNGLPARFSRMYANRLIETLGWKDLKFTLEETKRLFNPNGRLAHSYIRQLHQRADGWVSGMILLNENSKRGACAAAAESIASPDNLFNYFAVEVFAGCSKGDQEFLLKTSFLSQTDPVMAERLTGAPNANSILSRLSRGHFFTTRHSGENPVYQYHPLFREFLLSKAKEVFSAAELLEIKTQAAGLLAGIGRVEDAALLYEEAGAFGDIERLILENAGALARQGRAGTVGKWIGYLPAEHVAANPWLLYWKGISLAAENPLEGRACLEKAFHTFRARNERAPMFLAWCDAAGITLHCNEFSGIEAWLRLLKEITDESPVFPSAEIETRVILNIFNLLTIKMHEGFDVDAYYNRAFSLMFSEEQIDAELKVTTGVFLCFYFLWNGDMARAGIIMDMFENLKAKAPAGKPITDLSLIGMQAAKALYEFFSGMCAQCIGTVEDALELSGLNGVHVWDDHLLGTAAAAALSQGDSKAAGKALASMCAAPGTARVLDQAYCYFLKSWHSALRDDFEGAHEYLQLSGGLVPKSGYLPTVAAVHAAQAELLHIKGDHRASGAEFKMATDMARHMKSACLEFMVLIIRAGIALESGGGADAAALLKRAFPIARKHGLANMYWWRPAVMARLCEKALAEGIETQYVTALIRKRGLLPDPLPVTGLWPYPLKIYTFDRFELSIDGQPLESGGKMPKKPLALLKLLAAKDPDGATQEEITDSLWPETDGDLAMQSLDTTMHRIRKIIRNEKAVVLRNGRISLNQRYVWTDLRAFQSLCARAEKENAPARVAGLLEDALKLYKGKFLPSDSFIPWVLSKQDKLSFMVSGLIARLGEIYEERGELEKAAAVYRKGTELINTAEEFYQKLMLSLSRLGRRTEAISVYKNCQVKLNSLLEIEPSSKTKAIYSGLLEKRAEA